MKLLTVQYLEYAPPGATPALVREKLRQAFDILPISAILLGWGLPAALEEAVAEETAAHHAALYRWHPILCSDTGKPLPGEWRTIGVKGEPIPGFRGLPEFTFICPNRVDVQDWIAERIEIAARRGLYQGIFFDRMRFPSPAEAPERFLACFCPSCQRAAADLGLDLAAVRSRLLGLLTSPQGAVELITSMFSSASDPLLETFFRFRLHSITKMIQVAAGQAHSHGLAVGLDCFSTSLARMVGQDLAALDPTCDWIKLMIYPRVFGPAGLPFELFSLSRWLGEKIGIGEEEAKKHLEEASGFSFLVEGLGRDTISKEIQRGRGAGVTNLLPGIALVEVEGIHQPTLQQIQSDLTACGQAGVEGLALSWDLWHIRPHYLHLVKEQLKI